MSTDRFDAPASGRFSLDGQTVEFHPGDSLLDASLRGGHFIPHLCADRDLTPHGSCRLCTVRINGRVGAACTVKASDGLKVESNTPELNAQRRTLLQMLFVEGNHFCPSCERSGACELQATAYQLGMDNPHFEALSPSREVDASHPDVLLDHNRCILCERCARASREVDGKNVFAMGHHGIRSVLLVNSPSGKLGDSALAVTDAAVAACPVGALLPKRQGFAVPIGQRRYDRAPIAEQLQQEAE